MSDDLFTLDLSGMDLEDLIQVVNEMDSKLNNKIIPEILEEVGDELIDEERRMLQGRSNKDRPYCRTANDRRYLQADFE